MRSDGTRFDKAGYIEDPSTVIEVVTSDVDATISDDVLVVSYVLSVDIVLDNVETKSRAPRLSVFHLGGDGRWRIASHANFGVLDQES